MFVLISDKLNSFTAAAPRLQNWLMASFELYGATAVLDTSKTIPEFNRFETMLEIEQYFLNLEKEKTTGVRNNPIFKYPRFAKSLVDFGLLPALRSVLWVYFHRGQHDFLMNKVVVVTSPSFHNVIIGAAWKLMFKSHLVIADMRDEWSKHPDLNKTPIHRLWEKLCLGIFDRVVTVSVFIKRRLSVNHDVPFVIYNNSSARRMGRETPLSNYNQTPNFTVRYFGGLHPEHYNYVLLGEFINSNPNLNFEFYADRLGKGHPMEAILSGKNVSLHPLVPRSIALQLQTEPGVVNLFLCHKGKSNAGVVSTKLTEFIFSDNPFLVLDNCESSDVTLLLNKYCNYETSAKVNSTPSLASLYKKRQDATNPHYDDFRSFLLSL